MFAGATRDRTPAEIASDANRELQDGRNHNDAFGLVEQVLRDSVGMFMISFNTWPHVSSRFCSLLSFAANVGLARNMATTRTPVFLMTRPPGIYFILSSQGADHNCPEGQPCPKSKRGVQVWFRGSSSREWRRQRAILLTPGLESFG